MIVDELIALLGYRIEGEQNLKKFNAGMDRAEKSARKTSGSMKGLGAGIAVAGAAAGALGAKGFTHFAAFERKMARTGLTAQATAKQTAAAASIVESLAFDFAMPVEQAAAGLDTLVSSGLDLKEALNFLPSVLATAQASGAASTDIANTALKSSSALKITAGEMQKAFDIMVAGGKAGQFELRDMAAFIPELANTYARLGNTGTEGLQKLVALLQTVREDTGSASAAATQLQNVFLKVYSDETANKFKKFGVDIRAELKRAEGAGEDVLSTFLKITNSTIDGDLSKLAQLFTDQELQLGIQSLITSQESFEQFLAAVNGANVDGSVFRDLNVILSDSQTKIDRLSVTWSKFMTLVGGGAAEVINPILESAVTGLSDDAKIDAQLKKEGKNFFERWVLTGFEGRQKALERFEADQANVQNTLNDNSDKSVTVNVGSVTVSNAEGAGPAVGAAVGNAVATSAASAARIPPTRYSTSGRF